MYLNVIEYVLHRYKQFPIKLNNSWCQKNFPGETQKEKTYISQIFFPSSLHSECNKHCLSKVYREGNPEHIHDHLFLCL